MVRSIVLVVLFVAIVTASLIGLYQAAYPFVLASPEAAASLIVSPEQTQELNNAAMMSDVVALAIFGGVLCAGFAILIAKSATTANRFIGGGVGLILGAAAGAFAGWLGHFMLNSQTLDIADPMVALVARWAIMLAPIALAAGLAVSIGGSLKRDAAGAIVCSIIGVVLAAIVFAVLSGVVTTAEPKHKIFPHYMSNRLLLLISSGIGLGAGIAFGLNSQKKESTGSAATTQVV